MSLILLITAIILQSISAQQMPIVSRITEKQIRNVGETVEFRCSILYGQDYPVLWVKLDKATNNQFPLASKTSLIIPDNRFVVDYDKATSSYILMITDIQVKDAGTYECQVHIALNNYNRGRTELKVHRAPSFSNNSTRAVVALDGDSVVLECYADGSPIPKITWRRKNNAILSTGGSTFQGNVLKISSVRKEDIGYYYCFAENGIGPGVQREMYLQVHFAPIIWAPQPRIGEAIQFNAELKCQVKSYPSAAITWLKDDVELSSNQHYNISNSPIDNESLDTILQVVTIERKQYGQYVCRAANQLGHADATIELFETFYLIKPSVEETSNSKTNDPSLLSFIR